MLPAEALYHSKTCKYRCIENQLPHKSSYLSRLALRQYKRELQSQHSIRKYHFSFLQSFPSFLKCYSVVKYLIGPTASVFFFFYLPSSIFFWSTELESRIARRRDFVTCISMDARETFPIPDSVNICIII